MTPATGIEGKHRSLPCCARPRRIPSLAAIGRLPGESPCRPSGPPNPAPPTFRCGPLCAAWPTLREVRLHTLRHTVVSHAVMNGVPVSVVSRLLGHSNAQMTLRYAHLAEHDVEADAERIGEAMVRVMKL